ncbi:hypothetical protein ABR737_01030 [Streptomyces sp. Edi2]|uniref:hypothetical protein n=1 Tax=Streptomyces sp. Edi2 TaxID=3162528 RepID=UPI0033062C52
MIHQRPLGPLQQRALINLAALNSGSWKRGCGWQIGTPSQTERILDSLAERGFASKTTASGRFDATEAGLNYLGWYTCHTCTRLTRRPHRGHFLGTDRHIRCQMCFKETSIGLCERCSGECQSFRPGPRVSVYHLAVSRICHDVLITATAGQDCGPVHVPALH